jgi:SAM-dependent methyltransferase
MKECSKSIARRLADPNFASRYFAGSGLDVGGKPDPLGLYRELFCRMDSVRTWDIEDGDAQLLHGVADEAYDFVHSSHCLEHLADPKEGLRNWLRVVKPGGHLVVTVPDEDLYEQGVFPSTFNRDHKWTFTIFKTESWSPRSVNLLDLLRELGPAAETVHLELLSATYRFELPRYDQTLSPVGESGIELVIRKRTAAEIAAKGRWVRGTAQPDREMRVHLNQHRDDLATLKRGNEGKPPFGNDGSL